MTPQPAYIPAIHQLPRRPELPRLTFPDLRRVGRT